MKMLIWICASQWGPRWGKREEEEEEEEWGGREFVNDEGGGDVGEWQPTCAAV